MNNQLFDTMKNAPLAERLRPDSLEDIVGQQEEIQKTIMPFMGKDYMPSFILWGPTGCGKTSCASLMGKNKYYDFISLSALSASVGELRKILENAEKSPKPLILFIDEIHYLNKNQQDVFLPFMERGIISLIGATTENPSFTLNNALLSRSRTVFFESLRKEDMLYLCDKAEVLQGQKLPIDDEAKEYIILQSKGDGRHFLNMIETIYAHDIDTVLDTESLSKYLYTHMPYHDKQAHYDFTSALIKSVRASDVDGALYYMEHLLQAGEDVLYILRRLQILAVEDIGLADPQALVYVQAARNHFTEIGMPEGRIVLSNVVCYLATSPKSNAAYKAMNAVKSFVKKHGHNHKPPLSLMNASSQSLRDKGYAEGYKYDHDSIHGFAGNDCFPPSLERQEFYHPHERGFERDIYKRKKWFDSQRIILNKK